MLAEIYMYRWRGILFAIIVSALLTLGLLMRSQFVGEASVDIGGTFYIQGGQPLFMPFEDGSRIEAFYNNWMFDTDTDSKGLFRSCSAKAAFSPDGQILNIHCGGRTEEEVRQTIMSAIRPLLNRHEKLYQMAMKINEKEKSTLKRQMSKSEKIIEVWRMAPTSAMSEAEIINQTANIEDNQERLMLINLLDDRFRPSKFNVDKILIINRKPNLETWLLVLLISLGAGAGVSLFSARIKEIEA